MSIRCVVRGIIAGVSVKFFMQYVIIPLGHAAGLTLEQLQFKLSEQTMLRRLPHSPK